MTTFRLLLLMTCSFFSLGFTLGTLLTNRRRDRRERQTRLEFAANVTRSANQRRQVIPLFTPRGVK